MARRFPDLPYIGPLKRGSYLRSESPLEEVWAWISRIGTTEWLQRSVKSTEPWENWGPYAVARVRQAVEFRAAARNISILTRPLPLYYSLLNLLRGFLAISESIESKKGHGLSFTGENKANFFDMGAKLIDGTFTNYLNAIKIPYQKNTVITLGQAFSRIVEIGDQISLSVWTPEVF
jgi:hypothetical protein